MRTLLRIAFVLLISLSALTSYAAPYLLSFELQSVQGARGFDANSLVGARYEFIVNFDESEARGTITESDGSVTYPPDVGGANLFYVEPIHSNYITLGNPPGHRYFSSAPADYHLGVWDVFGDKKENVFGSGSTYGSFLYQTRVSLWTQSFDDLVAVDGFWYDPVAYLGPASFFTPGAIWMISDRDIPLSGGDFSFGSYWVSLRSVSPVPEPATWVVLVSGLGLLASRRRILAHQYLR